jgi:hypothetical protein
MVAVFGFFGYRGGFLPRQAPRACSIKFRDRRKPTICQYKQAMMKRL